MLKLFVILVSVFAFSKVAFATGAVADTKAAVVKEVKEGMEVKKDMEVKKEEVKEGEMKDADKKDAAK